jgi:hypothetical protein
MKTRTTTRITARRVLAPVLAAAAIALLPAPAHACTSDSECIGTCDTTSQTCQSLSLDRQDSALALAGTGVTFAGIGLLILPFGFRDPHSNKPTWTKVGFQTILFGFGGASALFGGLGLGLQSGVSGPCPFKSECQITWGLGATSLAVGAAMIAGGIVASVTPARLFPQGRFTPTGTSPWYAGIRPVPLVIPTGRGATVGLGIGGINL